MKLRVGLIGDSPGWQLLLLQEGVPFTVLTDPDELANHAFSIIILHSAVAQGWGEAIKKFVERGGGLLSVTQHYLKIFGGKGNRVSIRYMVPHEHGQFAGVGLADIFSIGTIAERAQWYYANGKVPSILIERVGEGAVVAVPVDFGALSLDTRARRKAFYLKGNRLPSERVSLVSKGEIRKIIHHLLRSLHTELGIPYCHIWYFPDGVHNVFALRIDTDNGTENEVETLYRLAEGENIRMSWFLHVEAHKEWLATFSKMSGHEIAVHCYRHRVATRADMQKAFEVLRTFEFTPQGFAAPYGVWSENIQRAAEELGFLYSSEFSFDYDNLPSTPIIGNTWSRVLQIPIHPICIGTFRRCRVSDNDIIDYFDRVVAWKLAAREPLFFYHHPRDGNLDVLRHIIRLSRRENQPNLLYSEYASWWKKRMGWRIDIELADRTIHLQGNLSPDACLRIIRDDEEVIVRIDRAIHLSEIPWRKIVPAPPLPSDILRIRKFSPRLVFAALQTSWRRAFQ